MLGGGEEGDRKREAQPQTSAQAQRPSPAGYSGCRPQRRPWFESSEHCTQAPGIIRRSSCSGSGEMKYQSWEIRRKEGAREERNGRRKVGENKKDSEEGGKNKGKRLEFQSHGP